VTDRVIARRPLPDVIEECLGAGLRAVQVREKDLAVRDLLALAVSLREVTRRHGARLVINDRADVGLAVDADGVQRTHASLPVAALRRIVAPPALVGASVHGEAEARQAVAEGADFLVFGPVHDTPSKRQYGKPQGLHALEQLAAAVDRPVIAIGGITPERARGWSGRGGCDLVHPGRRPSCRRHEGVPRRARARVMRPSCAEGSEVQNPTLT
jgi:thiamine-phosphate pyrophosphorylase